MPVRCRDSWLTNRALGEILGLSPKRVSALLSDLERRGHVETEIQKDEETQPAEPLEETEEETTPISELVREAMENYHFDMNTVNNIYNNLRLAGQKANNSIVTVHSVTRDTDWFDNSIENAGQYAGAYRCM